MLLPAVSHDLCCSSAEKALDFPLQDSVIKRISYKNNTC